MPLGRAFLALLLAAGCVAAELPTPVAPDAQQLFESAQTARARGDLVAAYTAYLEAQKTDPLVLALDDRGLLADLEGWLTETLAADAGDLQAHFRLAKLKAVQGALEDAMHEYREVMRLAPGSALAGLARPRVDELDLRIKEAAAALAAATPPKPTEPPAPSIEDLEARNRELEGELEDTRARLRALESSDTATSFLINELERTRKDFTEYRKQAEHWKSFYYLYFVERARRKSSGLPP